MAIRDNEILDVTPTKLNRTESLYVVNVFKGLGTTLKHCFKNIGRGGAKKAGGRVESPSTTPPGARRTASRISTSCSRPARRKSVD